MASKAGDKTNKAVEDETAQLEELNTLFEKYENGGVITPEPQETKVKDLVDKKVDKNTKAEDKYGNFIVIPEGFKIVPDLTTNDVDYTYAGNKEPVVQDGIVIEDASRNGYKWKSICMGASWNNKQ